MRANLQALRYFEVVARTQHFTRAAQELYLSQSTLSKSIDSLEKEIGVPLFEKQGRNVQLTKYGTILKDYVQRGTAEIDSGIQMIQSMVDTQTGSIQIASIFTVGAQFLPPAIKAFITQHPGISVKYYQKATTAILDQLVAGDIDIGFPGEFSAVGEYACLNSEVVLSEELCLIVAQDHPLATRTSIDFNEVLDETFVGWNEDTGIYHSINQVLDKAGIQRKLKCRFSATEDSTMVGMVREGLGIGLLSTIPTINTDGVVPIKISHPFFYRNLYMVWNKERYLSPAAKSFRKFMLTR